ncbi:MAG: RnfABCDGE type electron transport complex subunit G [Bacteroidales bacterium]|nr:RnfABCDGE type electron transport complex subunit G [Bacteroidales bacterium]
MAKTESTFVNMLITLFAVTAVAALALGGVYTVTKEPIELAKQKKIQDAIGKVLPAFDSIGNEYKILVNKEDKDSLTVYEAVNGQGEVVGVAYKTYTDKGFSGRFWIMVGFVESGIIHNTAVLEHKETPGLGDKMDKKKSDWPNQFQSLKIEEEGLAVIKDGGSVDAITAATISSRAFCDAVNRAFKGHKNQGGK